MSTTCSWRRTATATGLYLTADAPNDMRVLDIADLDNISEIGRYTHPEASNSNYVHDMTVIDHGGSIGRRVYVSYWNAGLMILDAADVTPGVIEPGSANQPLNPNHSIDPTGFLVHDAYPSADGSRVFIEDEFIAEEPAGTDVGHQLTSKPIVRGRHPLGRRPNAVPQPCPQPLGRRG